MITRECKLETRERNHAKRLSVNDRLRGSALVNLGFDEKAAVGEAQRCLGNVHCESCDLCRLFCPDLCITRADNTGQIEIDYNYCRGCGICAVVCPNHFSTFTHSRSPSVMNSIVLFSDVR